MMYALAVLAAIGGFLIGFAAGKIQERWLYFVVVDDEDTVERPLPPSPLPMFKPQGLPPAFHIGKTPPMPADYNIEEISESMEVKNDQP